MTTATPYDCAEILLVGALVVRETDVAIDAIDRLLNVKSAGLLVLLRHEGD